MITTINLVRHGETDWNVLGKFQGCMDTVLSKDGILQAEQLKKRFYDKFDFIYTSPLKRALKTAEIISESKDNKVNIAPGLREIDFGDWEGLTIREIETNFPEKFINWRNDELEGPMCGGDLSIKIASIRAKKTILEITEKHQGENIIIVAHGGIIKAGLIGIFDWKMTMYHKIILGNTALCKIAFDDSLSPTIIKINDTSHLPEK